MFVELRVLCAGGTRLAPTGVDTETAEHGAIRVIVKSVWQVERTINYEIRQIFKSIPPDQAQNRGE